MHILAATAASAQPDYVALAMVLALLLAVAIATLRKYLKKGKPVAQVPAAAAEASAFAGSA